MSGESTGWGRASLRLRHRDREEAFIAVLVMGSTVNGMGGLTWFGVGHGK